VREGFGRRLYRAFAVQAIGIDIATDDARVMTFIGRLDVPGLRATDDEGGARSACH
jgi:hypothetical protein